MSGSNAAPNPSIHPQVEPQNRRTLHSGDRAINDDRLPIVERASWAGHSERSAPVSIHVSWQADNGVQTSLGRGVHPDPPRGQQQYDADRLRGAVLCNPY